MALALVQKLRPTPSSELSLAKPTIFWPGCNTDTRHEISTVSAATVVAKPPYWEVVSYRLIAPSSPTTHILKLDG